MKHNIGEHIIFTENLPMPDEITKAVSPKIPIPRPDNIEMILPESELNGD